MARGRLLVGIAILCTVVVVALVLVDRRGNDITVVDTRDSANGAAVLLDADSSGAVVWIPDGPVFGVSRDGRRAWTRSGAAWQPIFGTCAPRCPAAVLSQDDRNVDAPLAPDPAPDVEGGAKLPAAMRAATGGKAAIVAVSASSILRVGSAPDGQPRIWVSRGDRMRAVDAQSRTPIWLPTNDRTAGVLAFLDKRGTQQLWVLSSGSWRALAGGSTGGPGKGLGCVAAGGERWVIDGNHIVAIDGSRVPLPPRVAGGECGFSRNRLVMVSHAAAGDGALSTRVEVLDLRARSVSTNEFNAEMWLTTDVTGDHFALVGNDKVVVFDADGRRIAVIDGVVGARFDEKGNLVTVTRGGDVAWKKL